MGIDARASSETIRISLGRTTIADDVDYATERISGEAEAYVMRTANAAARKKASRAAAVRKTRSAA